MFAIAVGVVIGIGLPIQTSINTRLMRKVGTPYRATLISFAIGTAFLIALTGVYEHSLAIPFGDIVREPFWIWLGGIFGVVFLTCNIVLMPRLGSVQTVIMPMLGQIIMGLLIDNFSLFYSPQIRFGLFRGIGAALVLIGALIIANGKRAEGEDGRNKLSPRWPWYLLGVIGGMLSSAQTAVNGYLGVVIDSRVSAALISFSVGTLALLILNAVLGFGHPETAAAPQKEKKQRDPWWIWLGGVLGALFVFGNVYLAQVLGTGMTVIVTDIGMMAGGLLVDQFGLFASERKPITIAKIAGIICMACGAAFIHLL
ncbi:MAG: DMT family transporter [Anaerovoracaceae bacterium]|jgi:transporter family-2 protein